MNWKEINIDELGLHDILTLWAEESPDTEVLIYEGCFLFKDRVEKYTFKEMDLITNKFAHALIKLGIKKGDRIALYLPNCPEFIIAYFGIFKAGATVVPMSPIYTSREITYQLNDTAARIVITASYLIANIDRNAVKDLEKIISINESDDALLFYDILSGESGGNGSLV